MKSCTENSCQSSVNAPRNTCGRQLHSRELYSEQTIEGRLGRRRIDWASVQSVTDGESLSGGRKGIGRWSYKILFKTNLAIERNVSRFVSTIKDFVSWFFNPINDQSLFHYDEIFVGYNISAKFVEIEKFSQNSKFNFEIPRRH